MVDIICLPGWDRVNWSAKICGCHGNPAPQLQQACCGSYDLAAANKDSNIVLGLTFWWWIEEAIDRPENYDSKKIYFWKL